MNKMLSDEMVLKQCDYCKKEGVSNCSICMYKDRYDEITTHKIEKNSLYGERNMKQPQLTLNEYQTLANVTRNKELDTTDSLTNYALGLTGEAGEVADIIKKFVFHDHPLDVKDVIKELGDVMWYIATLASTLGVDLEHIACQNIDKLRKRYPEGFDQSKSINRTE